MTSKVKSVYEDLKYANADEMLIKARLVTEIADQLKLRRLTQAEAAQLLGFSQPKLSNLLRGQFGVFAKEAHGVPDQAWSGHRDRRETRTAFPPGRQDHG